MSDFTDRPASHAAAHANGKPCPCRGVPDVEKAVRQARREINRFWWLIGAVLVLAVVAAIWSA